MGRIINNLLTPMFGNIPGSSSSKHDEVHLSSTTEYSMETSESFSETSLLSDDGRPQVGTKEKVIDEEVGNTGSDFKTITRTPLGTSNNSHFDTMFDSNLDGGSPMLSNSNSDEKIAQEREERYQKRHRRRLSAHCSEGISSR
jgi:hypothetical protein